MIGCVRGRGERGVKGFVGGGGGDLRIIKAARVSKGREEKYVREREEVFEWSWCEGEWYRSESEVRGIIGDEVGWGVEEN